MPAADEREAPSGAKNTEAFAELVQCLDDRSLALVIREAKDDGRRALQVLREHYQGKGKPRIIALYTELTPLEPYKSCEDTIKERASRASLRCTPNSPRSSTKEGESTTDYILRVEKAATALKEAGEMTFSEFKTALRNHEEKEKSCNRTPNNGEGDNVMATRQGFQGNCFKCGKKGHKRKDCYSKQQKWCHKCKNSTHSTRDCQRRSKEVSRKRGEHH